MKKRFCLILAVLLLLTACGAPAEPKTAIQPVTFYYRTAETDFSAADGVIRGEIRDLGTGTWSDLELFQAYFQGPESPELVSPVSQDTELISVSRTGGTLELHLVRNANSPAEFDHALTYACLAKTGLGLEGVRKVRIRVSTRGGALEADLTLSESDILLFDSGEPPQTTELTLYYADADRRFLLPEKRTVPRMNGEELPQAVIDLLLGPPQSGGMQSALPPGTALLDVSVENGICYVDFNGDFYANRPQEEQAEALAVLSVVNTLCELEQVNQVQLYTEGRRLERYEYLDLSAPLLMDSAVVGPVREELGEFAGTLCLPGRSDGLLHRLTVRCRARGGATREEALLDVLLGRTAQNGLTNPLAGAKLLSVQTEDGICHLSLSPESLPADPETRASALRSLAATLCTLPEIDAVVLGGEEGLLVPAPDWFAAGETSPSAP